MTCKKILKNNIYIYVIKIDKWIKNKETLKIKKHKW